MTDEEKIAHLERLKIEANAQEERLRQFIKIFKSNKKPNPARGKSGWNATVIVAIIGAVVTTLGYWNNAREARQLEAVKNKQQLVLKAIETGDDEASRSNLTFLLSAGLLDVDSVKFTSALATFRVQDIAHAFHIDYPKNGSSVNKEDITVRGTLKYKDRLRGNQFVVLLKSADLYYPSTKPTNVMVTPSGKWIAKMTCGATGKFQILVGIDLTNTISKNLEKRIEKKIKHNGDWQNNYSLFNQASLDSLGGFEPLDFVDVTIK